MKNMRKHKSNVAFSLRVLRPDFAKMTIWISSLYFFPPNP